MNRIIMACVFVLSFVSTNAAMPDTTLLSQNTKFITSTITNYDTPKINENNVVILKTQGLTDNANTKNNVLAKIMNDIQQNLDRKNEILDSTVLKLDWRVGKLDSLIKITGNPKERFDRLVERVQVLEEKQKAIEQNEINVYEANYQSAIINLVSMDREIKPLYLFHATKDFFNALTETSNPMSYEEFRKGFENFRIYVDKVKETNATQKAVSEIIGASGFLTSGIPIVGAYSQLMFTSMAEYVNSIGHKKRELKVEAEKMFALTASLSQFTTDKIMIENEWDGIAESLDEMQIYYDTVLKRNLRMINVNKDEFTNEFTHQGDASKRYMYLTMLRKKAADYVICKIKEDPKDWKENIYYQLMGVQCLKVRYGDVTYRIKHHINKYNSLITKYKNNKQIGLHISTLGEKLNQLKSTFDDAFEPEQYVHSATQMYKVI